MKYVWAQERFNEASAWEPPEIYGMPYPDDLEYPEYYCIRSEYPHYVGKCFRILQEIKPYEN
jgi:hypothetical protein